MEGEVQEGEAHEEEIQKEFADRPLKSDHCVHYNSVDDSLDQRVWNLNDGLQYIDGIWS